MKHFYKFAVALVLALGLFASTVQTAEAGKKGRLIAGGILGAIAIGILADEAARAEEEEYEERCYKGKRVCKKVRRCWENQYGDERCSWKRKCYRRTICD